MFKQLCCLLTCLALISVSACAQDKASRPSPPAKAECKLAGGKTVTIDYSSPRAKGRKIYGDLVPYGKVWRAGANEATTFVTDTDLNVGGTSSSRRQLYHLHRAQRRQMATRHQQENRRVGHRLSRPERRPRAHRHESLQAPVAVGKFHHLLRSKPAPAAPCDMDWETTRASVDIALK